MRIFCTRCTTVGHVDIFIANNYRKIIIESLEFCQKNKGLQVYCWCLMPATLDLICSVTDNDHRSVMRDFKSFTSRRIREEIQSESNWARKKWQMAYFTKFGRSNKANKKWQFWRQDYEAIPLFGSTQIEQKINQIHALPVKAGFVRKPKDWIWSSAADYDGDCGPLAFGRCSILHRPV